MKAKRVVVLLLVSVIFIGSLMAMDLKEFVETAKQRDMEFLEAMETYQQAKDDYDKAMVSAVTELDKINAEITLLNSEKTYRNSVLKLYQNVLGTYYSLISDLLDLRIQENTLKIAGMDLDEQTQLYQKGLAVEEDLKDASITYRQAVLDKAAAEFTLGNDLEELKWRTGIELKSDQITFEALYLPDITEIELSTDTYLKDNLDIKISELNLKRAKLNLDSLTSASQYEVNKAKRSLTSAERSRESTIHSVSLILQEQLFNLGDLYERYLLAKESWDVQKSRFENTKAKYEKGLISEKELLSAENQLLSKARAYFQSERSYLLALIEFLLNSGYDEPLKIILDSEG